MKEHEVPNMYVRTVENTYEEAMIHANSSGCVTGMITCRGGLHQGFTPVRHYNVLDVLGSVIKEHTLGECCLKKTYRYVVPEDGVWKGR